MKNIFAKIAIFWLLFFNLNTISFAQIASPYTWKPIGDPILLGSGLATNGIALGLQFRIKPFSENEINTLDIRNICPIFDQSATRQQNNFAKKSSDWLDLAAVLTPAILLGSKNIRQQKVGLTLTMGLETMMLVSGLTGMVKGTAQRPRPYVYNPNFALPDKLKKDAKQSFFSGHSSTAAAACFFTAKIYADFYPESRWKPFVWSGAVILPATVGYLRYKSGKHFPTDIITGLAVGSLCGWLVPHLHKKK